MSTLTNVRSRFNDWMFKALFFIITISLMSLTANGVLAADNKIDIMIEPSSSTYDGSSHAPDIKVYDSSDAARTPINDKFDISYKGTKAEVEKPYTGQAGTYGTDFTNADTITFNVKGKDKSGYDGVSKTASYEIKNAKLDGSYFDVKNKEYTGSPITPEVTKSESAPDSLTDNDYTVKVAAKANSTDKGSVDVVIEGKNNYEGSTITKSFLITAKKFSDDTVKVDTIKPQEYTGSEITVTGVSVVDKELDRALVEGKDYKIEKSEETGNINVGDGKVKIVGMGNYDGFVPKDFEITAKELSSDMFADIPDKTYTGSNISPSVTLKDGSALPEGLTVAYKNNKDVSTDTKTAKAIITGNKNYSGSAEIGFKIVGKPIGQLTPTISNQTYTGSEIKPDVKIVDIVNGSEVTLAKDTDYTIEYPSEDYKNVGIDKKVVIKGKGNYSGEVEKTFNITPATVTFSDLSASKIVYGESLAESKITGKAFDANNQEIEGTFEFVNPLIKPELKDKANLNDMEYEATVNFKSKDGNSAQEVKVPVKVANWGEPILNNGIMNWVSENGTTSTKVQASGISWLKEDSENSFTWYGIENSLKKDGTLLFAPGSRFWVRWLSKSDSDWPEEYAKIDPKYKEDVDNGRLYIFKMGVTDPDGNEYEQLGTYIDAAGNTQNYLANVYIQLGSDWDERDLRSMCVLTGEDEKITVSYVDNIPSAPVSSRFAKLEVPHFSTWGLYDSLYGGSDGFYTSGTKSSKSTTGTGSTLLGSTGSTTSGSSSSKGSSTSGSGTSYGSLNLYKSTGEDKYASMMPMILPIVLFVLIYGKKKVNKDL